MITRAYILEVLEGELNALEERELEDSAANALHQVLQHLIAGLKALEGGEAPPLFVPKKVKARGKWPATVRKLRLHAICAVATLRMAGCLAHEATSLVADAFAVDDETVRKWRKTLGKATKDTEDVEALTVQLHWAPRIHGPWTKDRLLDEVKRKGEEFKKAQVKKGK
jgi:hypothetical protein